MSTKVNEKFNSSKSGTKNLISGKSNYLHGVLVGDGLSPSNNMVTGRPSENINSLNISDLYIESIDWLSLFLAQLGKGRSKRFIMTDLKKETRLYKGQFLITDEKLNIKVGVICCLPKSPVLPPESCTLKFDNEILYLKLFNYKYCVRLFKALELEYKNVTRLDICRDIQRFKNVLPDELIENFSKGKYLCMSKGNAKFSDWGSLRNGGKNYEYLRIGKMSSGREFYLYNKSLELKEVGDKEHIREIWNKAGFNKDIDVWRLEERLTKGKRNILLDERTGELIKIDLKKVFDKRFRKMVYDAGLKSSFRFVENGNVRKTRCKEVVLFSGKGKNIKLVRGKGQTDQLRMRKIIVKKEIRDLLQDRETREHKTRGIQERIDWVNDYVKDHNMERYLLKIIDSLGLEFETESFGDLGKFVYNYFGKKGGYCEENKFS